MVATVLILLASVVGATEASLEGTGQRGVTLDAFAGPTTRIEVDFALTKTNPPQQRIYGADYRGVGFFASLYVNSRGEFSFGVGDTFRSYPTGVPADTRRHLAILDVAAKRLRFFTDGTLVYDRKIDNDCTRRSAHPIGVLGGTISPTGRAYVNCSAARVFSAKVYEDGNLVRDYLPTRQGDVPGLKDNISGHFAECAWRIPHWDPILTQPGALGERFGHIQGFCMTRDALYVTQDGSFAKVDWRGRLIKNVKQPGRRVHVGDICHWKDRLYAAICVYPADKGFEDRPGEERRMPGCIQVMDEDLNIVRTVRICRSPDGIVCLDGVLYIGMGQANLNGTWRGNWYGKFDVETLEPLCEPFVVDHGFEAAWGVQNMTTDGEFIYVNYYTPQEGLPTPNFVKYDKDLKVVDYTVLGHGQGVDFVPGGKNGTRRFMCCVTINGTFNARDAGVEVQGLLYFNEWRGGKDVVDITHYVNYLSPAELW